MADASTNDIEPLDPPKGITTSATGAAPHTDLMVKKAAELLEVPVKEAAVRANLAIIFTVIFVATGAAGFVSSFFDLGWDRTKELLQMLLPAEIAFLGSAVGFYFGTRKDGG